MTHFLTARLFLKKGVEVKAVEEELAKVEGMKIEECTITKEAELRLCATFLVQGGLRSPTA